MSNSPLKQPRDTVFDSMADAAIYSEVPEINAFLPAFIEKLHHRKILFENAEPISYGSRITVRSGETATKFNVYFSKKKGFSLVPSGKAPKKTLEEIRFAFHQSISVESQATEKEKSAHVWIGSDEAGKGDFLGPLVTAAVCINRKLEDELRMLGVQDSKNLSLVKCREIARKIFVKHKNRVNVVELVPETYNRLYKDFVLQKKNLNDLLGWSHGKAIEKLFTPEIDLAVVDKFAADHVVRKWIRCKINLVIRSKAEDNPAVAAASIMARARYLYRLEKLSEEYGITLAAGSGEKALNAAREAVRKHGPEVLSSISKTHFKSARYVLND